MRPSMVGSGRVGNERRKDSRDRSVRDHKVTKVQVNCFQFTFSNQHTFSQTANKVSQFA